MSGLISRVTNIIVRPSDEWPAIERERAGVLRILSSYLAPLAAIGPIAFACSMLIGAEGALHPLPDSAAAPRLALVSALGAFIGQILGVLVTASVVWLVMPLYQSPRDFGAGFRLVAYAGTPIWLAGIVLVAPLQKFPVLTVIMLVAVMHAAYVFYLGLHHVAKVRWHEAAECAAIVVLASLISCTVVGYFADAIGLLG